MVEINPTEIKLRMSKAINSFKKAIAINPNYIQAHFNLGNLQRELGNHQSAMICYQKAIQIDPENINIINAISNLLKSFKIAFGSLIGFLGGTILKFVYSIVVIWQYLDFLI